jgi:hypothetical protein
MPARGAYLSGGFSRLSGEAVGIRLHRGKEQLICARKLPFRPSPPLGCAECLDGEGVTSRRAYSDWLSNDRFEYDRSPQR